MRLPAFICICLLGSAGTGCESSDPMQWPTMTGAKSAVIRVTAEETFGFASHVDGAGQLVFELILDGSAQANGWRSGEVAISVFGFERALEEVGLEPGPVEVRAPPSDCDLQPDQQIVWRPDELDPGSGQWEGTEPEVLPIVDPACKCHPRTVRAVEFEDERVAGATCRVIFAFDEQTAAYIGTKKYLGGGFQPGALVNFSTGEQTTFNFNFAAGVTAGLSGSDGRIYLALYGGQIMSWDPLTEASTLVCDTSTSASTNVVTLAGTPRGSNEPMEYFAITREALNVYAGSLWYGDANGCRKVMSFADVEPTMFDFTKTALVRYAPGRAAATIDHSPSIWWVDRDSAVEARWLDNDRNGPRSFAASDGTVFAAANDFDDGSEIYRISESGQAAASYPPPFDLADPRGLVLADGELMVFGKGRALQYDVRTNRHCGEHILMPNPLGFTVGVTNLEAGVVIDRRRDGIRDSGCSRGSTERAMILERTDL